jgi:hypothetical protein
MDGSLSNFRELHNLVDAIGKECEGGHLANAELFLFTEIPRRKIPFKLWNVLKQTTL